MNLNLASLWKKLSLWQQLAIVGAICLIIAFSAYQMKPSSYQPLYNNLSIKDMQDISKELDQMGVAYKTQTTNILVDNPNVYKIRAELANKGLPSSGGDPGLELFNQSSIGDTNFDKQVKYERALKGEIERGLVQGMGFVNKANVQLNFMLKQSVFDEASQSKATVSVGLATGFQIADSQIRAIQNMVAGSVRDLAAKDVVVIDEATGEILSDRVNNQDVNNSASYTKQMQIEQEMEKRVKTDIMASLAKVFGAENVALNVRANINFDEIVQNIEKYDPQGTLVSRQHTAEDTSKKGGTPVQTPGTASNANVPNYNSQDPTASADYSQKKDSMIENFEVGKTVETIKKFPQLATINVVALINKQIPQTELTAWLNEWQQNIAIAAGIKFDAANKMTNGVVKVSPQIFKQPNVNDPSQDVQQGSDLGFFAKNKTLLTWIFLIAGLAVILFIMMMWLVLRRKEEKQYLREQFASNRLEKTDGGPLDAQEASERRTQQLMQKIRQTDDETAHFTEDQREFVEKAKIVAEENPERAGDLVKKWLSER